MHHGHRKRRQSLVDRFPPSPPCSCAVCRGYCARPGWWSVSEAGRALASGYAGRMMLEVAPERAFGVLSPAFLGNEGGFALEAFAQRGCTFLTGQYLCELFGSGLQPLECRYCHHERAGQGPLCHAALERDWNTEAGQALVERWCRQMKLWEQWKRVRVKGKP